MFAGMVSDTQHVLIEYFICQFLQKLFNLSVYVWYGADICICSELFDKSEIYFGFTY